MSFNVDKHFIIMLSVFSFFQNKISKTNNI